MSVPACSRESARIARISICLSFLSPASATACLPAASRAFKRASTAGMRKAKVLPVPVLAFTRRSRGSVLSGSYGSASLGRRGRTTACTGLIVSILKMPVIAFKVSRDTLPANVSNLGWSLPTASAPSNSSSSSLATSSSTGLSSDCDVAVEASLREDKGAMFQ